MIADSNLKFSQVPDTADLKTAMVSMRQTGLGMAIVVDGHGKVVGIATDGDIRRALIEHEDVHQPVAAMMNRAFVSVPEGTPKERVLKLLDTRIRIVPVLDSDGRLVQLVRSGYAEPLREGYARARAPVRLSLAGGGTDFTGYFMEHGGVSLCTTIGKYAHAILRRRDDGRIRIYSHDHRQLLEFENFQAITYDGKLDLLKAGIKVMRPDFGFELSVSADYAPGTGLGGSAALLAAIVGCFNEYREDRLDSYGLAEMAFEAERVELSIDGGWQDQYSTVFGGFNYIEFGDHHNTVMPLRLQLHTLLELEERCIMCYSGRRHLGEAIQDENRKRDPNDPAVLSFAHEIKNIAHQMRANLLRGHLSDFGRMLDETWKLKKGFNAKVTDPRLDTIYNAALAAGAEGGRLLGTGGGGYFLFFVKPFERFQVMAALEDIGLTTECVNFDHHGLVSWQARV